MRMLLCVICFWLTRPGQSLSDIIVKKNGERIVGQVTDKGKFLMIRSPEAKSSRLVLKKDIKTHLDEATARKQFEEFKKQADYASDEHLEKLRELSVAAGLEDERKKIIPDAFAFRYGLSKTPDAFRDLGKWCKDRGLISEEKKCHQSLAKITFTQRLEEARDNHLRLAKIAREYKKIGLPDESRQAESATLKAAQANFTLRMKAANDNPLEFARISREFRLSGYEKEATKAETKALLLASEHELVRATLGYWKNNEGLWVRPPCGWNAKVIKTYRDNSYRDDDKFRSHDRIVITRVGKEEILAVTIDVASDPQFLPRDKREVQDFINKTGAKLRSTITTVMQDPKFRLKFKPPKLPMDRIALRSDTFSLLLNSGKELKPIFTDFPKNCSGITEYPRFDSNGSYHVTSPGRGDFLFCHRSKGRTDWILKPNSKVTITLVYSIPKGYDSAILYLPDLVGMPLDF